MKNKKNKKWHKLFERVFTDHLRRTTFTFIRSKHKRMSAWKNKV